MELVPVQVGYGRAAGGLVSLDSWFAKSSLCFAQLFRTAAACLFRPAQRVLEIVSATTFLPLPRRVSRLPWWLAAATMGPSTKEAAVCRQRLAVCENKIKKGPHQVHGRHRISTEKKNRIRRVRPARATKLTAAEDWNWNWKWKWKENVSAATMICDSMFGMK